MTIPPGITTITVTGTNLLGLDGTPLNGVVIFTVSAPVSDPAVNAILEGSATGEVTNGVMGQVTLPTTDCISPSFTYNIRQRLVTPDGEGGDTLTQNVPIPHTLGATVDLSALVP